jgi:hypothetical protein
VVLDTNDDAARGLAADYAAAMALTRAEGAPPSVWWVTHIPAIMLIDYDDAEHTGDMSLQADLVSAAGPAGLEAWFCGGGSCRPSQVLMGHQHLFQTVEFPDPEAAGGGWSLPRQVMVGHGGTKIDDSSPAPTGATRCRSDAFGALATTGRRALVAVVETVTRHGLVLWRRDAATLSLPAGWAMEPIWAGADAPPALSPGSLPDPACVR